MNGSGQIITADEIEAFAEWCEAIILTDRYNHSAYTDDIGIDYNEIFATKTQEEAEAIIESEISEALACDPYNRTLYVQKVTCEWLSPDEIAICVDVMALDNQLVTVNTTIKK